MKLDLNNGLSGWVLVKAHLGRHCQYSFPSLAATRHATLGETEEILLPVVGNGRICELIELPEDVSELVCRLPENEPLRAPGIFLRRVGWLERHIGMVSRILWTWFDLPRDGRRKIGLSLARAFFDLPQAYRLATRFSPKLQANPYPGWSARFNSLSGLDRRKIAAHIMRLALRPCFRILVLADDASPDATQRTLASLRRQLYRNFTYTIVDRSGVHGKQPGKDTGTSEVGFIRNIVGPRDLEIWMMACKSFLARDGADDWVLLMPAGDTLPEHALYRYAHEILAQPDAVIFYSDDDALDGDVEQPCLPRFKPDWSLAHLRSKHYIGDAVVLRGGAVAAAGGLTLDCLQFGNYDLLLRVIDAAGEKVAHVPEVLYHRRVPGTKCGPLDAKDKGQGKSSEIQDKNQVVQDMTFKARAINRAREDAWMDPWWCADKLKRHLERRGIAANVLNTLPGCRRVLYRLPESAPLVSIIVPTRDALGFLRKCLESVFAKTTYPRFELVVVDNQTSEPAALSYLDALARRKSVRVLRYDRPFNYSAINNVAARQARGDMLCLLNNDTEVVSPDWLEEMVGHLLQPCVGAVGARLLYADGRVQHGGVAVGPGGCADHLHADLTRDHPGYCHRAVIAQELSAVTGACMLTWKRLYEKLGGFDEVNLPVAFNDVDYCLRLQEAGYRVIYTPHAELYHHESATRGPDSSWRKMLRARREIRYMQRRWRERMKRDPYYNPNLSYEQPNFTLNWKPRVRKPWPESC